MKQVADVRNAKVRRLSLAQPTNGLVGMVNQVIATSIATGTIEKYIKGRCFGLDMVSQDYKDFVPCHELVEDPFMSQVHLGYNPKF